MPGYKPTTLAEWEEEFASRAAIIEYLGGETRATAEWRALREVGPKPREPRRGR